MQLYMIRRRRGWGSVAELEAAGARSIETADRDFPQEIRWIRSYVIDEGDSDTIGTVCIYEGSDEDAVRRHAEAVGMPADEIKPIVDTVIIRPDPAEAEAS